MANSQSQIRTGKKKYASPSRNKKIEDKINLNFGSFALPKKIYYLTELPKTRSGKILRRLLREMINSSNFEFSRYFYLIIL